MADAELLGLPRCGKESWGGLLDICGSLGGLSGSRDIARTRGGEIQEVELLRSSSSQERTTANESSALVQQEPVLAGVVAPRGFQHDHSRELRRTGFAPKIMRVVVMGQLRPCTEYPIMQTRTGPVQFNA